MADEGNRVEPRHVLVGRGMGVTPEKIAELEGRQAQMERAYRAPVEKSFADVFAQKAVQLEQEASEKPADEEEAKTIPRSSKTLASSYYRDDFEGADGDSRDPVIIKG